MPYDILYVFADHSPRARGLSNSQPFLHVRRQQDSQNRPEKALKHNLKRRQRELCFWVGVK